MADMQPSNWLSPSNDIAFHLTFRQANKNKIVMNSKPSGSPWDTEAVLYVPFNGPAKVDVSYDNSAGYMVRIKDLEGNYDDATYVFTDRILRSYTIASINGEATGTEIECSGQPPSPPPPTSGPVGCPTSKAFYEDFTSGDLSDK